jgi:hypothetical protein
MPLDRTRLKDNRDPVESCPMSWRWAVCAVVAVVGLPACDSGSSEAEKERASADAPAAKTVRAFYAAADDAAGEKACALLTPNGIQAVVRVKTRAACIRTIDGFEPGSFTGKDGELLKVEGVEEHGDGFDVNAFLKGRSAGIYSVVKRDGRLLIDGYKAEEG